MTAKENHHQAFLALLNAGLWETEVRLQPLGKIDFPEVYRLAKAQAVVGLVAAGLEHVPDCQVPEEAMVPFWGDTLKIEQRNQAMNRFVAQLFDVFRYNKAHALLVKGQGIAQCYERPLWRTSGDIDLLFDHDNYQRAKRNMLTRGTPVEDEDTRRLHLGLYWGPWVVELHGSLFLKFLPRVNRIVQEVQKEVLEEGKVRIWDNDGMEIPLPAPDEDVVFVFVHLLEHFFEFGIGLRQICDWCRLLYTYRESLDRELLEKRIRRMGILSEWNAFAAFAVETLEMPPEHMPLYSPEKKWSRKAARIRSHIFRSGNLGHNRDTGYIFAPFLWKKTVALRYMISENLHNLLIFPQDTLQVWYQQTLSGIFRAARGK